MRRFRRPLAQGCSSIGAIRPATNLVRQGCQLHGENTAIPSAIMLCDSRRSIQDLQDRNVSAHFWTFREFIDIDKWGEEHANLCSTIQAHAHPDTKVVLLNDYLPIDSDTKLARAFMDSPNLCFMRDPLCSLPWQPGTFFHSSHQPFARIFEPDLAALGATCLGFKPLFPKVDSGPYQLYNFDGGDLIPFVHNGVRRLLIGVGGNTSCSHLTFVTKSLPCRCVLGG
mmetsp:Transcript_48279/g.105424  ORF Transcript_48279/g.105424 Transcript_48279/m.105424 type:complete len:226 (-) Transcript_48279:431-1108(-)